MSLNVWYLIHFDLNIDEVVQPTWRGKGGLIGIRAPLSQVIPTRTKGKINGGI